MGRRKIDAPDGDWLTEEEAAAWLRVSAAELHRLVELGYVLSVRRINRRTTHYHWEGLAVAALRIKLAGVPEQVRDESKVGPNRAKLGDLESET